ncbi:aminoacetone oxidase family FAD-binding enzyme [Puniceicoccus vermicola]|uniref:NAD(P)/FAD-dependent oxidoreductase n=1 Tax=Puniceicoccus vermicola TaxID=388746 RepID=A0A7X1B1Q4_9BACT|nr:NAD(P)/FAD-dependent oxidoreductase [Puniceicoccus vermicola]
MTGTPSTSLAVIGGGAAGFYAAVTAAEANPAARVILYEKGRRFLTKVKISGGGRCNVTHHCFDPAEFSTRYPRGGRELKAAFHRWQATDTIRWFEERGMKLKAEEDGRMFPTTDNSQTVIDTLTAAAHAARVTLAPGVGVQDLHPREDGIALEFNDGSSEVFDRVCLAAGSLKGSSLPQTLERLGHTIEPLVPSLFALNVSDKRISGLAGISVPNAAVRIQGSKRWQNGPLLITHRGLSGPAILRLSAWEARTAHEAQYHFPIEVAWTGETNREKFLQSLRSGSQTAGKKKIKNAPLVALPQRLWEKLAEAAGLDLQSQWSQAPKAALQNLAQELSGALFPITGKTTNKEEFVTCGGVRRKEIDWRTMESKIIPHLHFAGECIDYDGITGGFNFQGAWTTGRIAGLTMAE